VPIEENQSALRRKAGRNGRLLALKRTLQIIFVLFAFFVANLSA